MVDITQGWGAGLGISVTVPLPPFPNIPALPGVPQLARSLLFQVLSPPVLGFAANPDVLWQATQSEPGWGVMGPDGGLALDPDSIHDLGWRQEYRVSNFPVQQGEFASYNKVRLPFETSVMMVKGGDVNERYDFLARVDEVTASLDLYTIITPEKGYVNCNVTRAELSRRGSANNSFFDVELFFIQVIETTPQYSTTGTPTNNAQEPSAAPVTNQGLNNPITPSTSTQKAAIEAIALPVGRLSNLPAYWTN